MLATLVLVIVALTMGIILVSFDNTPKVEETLCEGIYDVNVVYVGDTPRICQRRDVDNENNSVSFLLENKASRDVDGLHMLFIGDSDKAENQVFIVRDYNASIKADGALSKVYKFPKSIGNLEQVKISVYRQMNSYFQLCKKYSIVLDNIPDCI